MRPSTQNDISEKTLIVIVVCKKNHSEAILGQTLIYLDCIWQGDDQGQSIISCETYITDHIPFRSIWIGWI